MQIMICPRRGRFQDARLRLRYSLLFGPLRFVRLFFFFCFILFRSVLFHVGIFSPVRFVSLSCVLFCFASFRSVLFRFVSCYFTSFCFRFASFCVVLFRFVSFRPVSLHAYITRSGSAHLVVKSTPSATTAPRAE